MGEDQASVKRLKLQLEEKREELRDGYFADAHSQGRPPNSKIDKRRELRGHFGKVYSIHWSGGGSDLIVSASQDGKMIVWNANTTNKINAIPLRSCWVMTCAFEQTDNSMVACGGLENICSVYKLNQNDAPGSPGGAGGAGGLGGGGITSSPGGMGGMGSSSRAYKELEGHDGYLSSCRFIGKGHIVTSSGDSSCRYWDVEGGRCLNYFKEHMGDVMSVSPHPTDPAVFVSGSVDTECKLWDIRTGNRSQGNFKPRGGHGGGGSYGYGGMGYAQRDPDEVEGVGLGSSMTFAGHESDINSTCYFPDGWAFGTGSDDASCRLFDTRCFQEVNSFRHQRILCGITSVAFSSSGRMMFGGYDDFSCVGWDTLNNPSMETQEAAPVVVLKKHENRVSCVGVHSRGQALATGSWDTTIKVWA